MTVICFIAGLIVIPLLNPINSDHFEGNREFPGTGLASMNKSFIETDVTVKEAK